MGVLEGARLVMEVAKRSQSFLACAQGRGQEKREKKLLLLLLSCVSNVFLLRLSFGVFFLVSFSCVFYEEKKIPQKTFRGE